MAKAKKNIHKQTKKNIVSPFKIYWGKENYYILIGGIFLAIIGFYFLSVDNWDSSESLYVAAILLFAVYVIVFPLSILFRKKTGQTSE